MVENGKAERWIISKCIPVYQVSKFEWLHARWGKLLGCDRGIAQRNSPYGL